MRYWLALIITMRRDEGEMVRLAYLKMRWLGDLALGMIAYD
ncbi:MAG TPA: hypothetical protein VHP83_09110 [Aggregatilineaceae bacterium]|nr:hypothetical protein [Aggregatilineaceae bacterium]